MANSRVTHSSLRTASPESWCFTVIKSKGLHFLRPEKSWRPIICISIEDKENARTSKAEYDIYGNKYETTLGLDGQNPNQKEVFIIGPYATKETKFCVQAFYQPPGKKKVKRTKRIPVASCTCTLGDVMGKQTLNQVKRYAQLRLQPQSASKSGKNLKKSDPATLYVRLRAPLKYRTEHVVETDVESHHPSDWPDSHTEHTFSPPTSPVEDITNITNIHQTATTSITTSGVDIHPGDHAQSPRKRKRKRIPGFKVGSDDEGEISVSASSSDDDEGYNSNEDKTFNWNDYDEEEESEEPMSPIVREEECKPRWPWIIRLTGIAGLMEPGIIPMNTQQQVQVESSTARRPERDNTLFSDTVTLDARDQDQDQDQGLGDRLWHRFERMLCTFTVYGELCGAARCLDSLVTCSKAVHSTGDTDPEKLAAKSSESLVSTRSLRSWGSSSSTIVVASPAMHGGDFDLLEREARERVEKVYTRLHNEWAYVGNILLALAAINTTIFAIASNDALINVNGIAKKLVATSSICSGCGILSVGWLLLWYGWGSGVGTGGDGAGGGLGGVDNFMSRALDINKTYVSFALTSRTPAACMMISVLSLLGFLCVAAYNLFPPIVWPVCLGVSSVMCWQFVVWGFIRIFRVMGTGIRKLRQGVRYVFSLGRSRGAEEQAVARLPEVVGYLAEPEAIADLGKERIVM